MPYTTEHGRYGSGNITPRPKRKRLPSISLSEVVNEVAFGADFIFMVCIILGLASIGLGFLGGYLRILRDPIPFWMVVGGIVVMILGKVIEENFIYLPPRELAPVPRPGPMPVHTPTNDVYGTNHLATPEEMKGWGDKKQRSGLDAQEFDY